MDLNSPVVRLCLAGNQAEFAGQLAEARACFWQAWQAARDDYEACIAAHYVARLQPQPEDELRWNLAALRHARAVPLDQVQDFFPSLYLALGHAYERLEQPAEARRYYAAAAALGVEHRPV